MKRIAFLIENITWPFDFTMAEVLGQHCKELGIQLLVYEARHENCHDLPEIFLNHRIDGLIVMTYSVYLSYDEQALQLLCTEIQIPCVTIGESFHGLPSVLSDNDNGIQQIMNHLSELSIVNIAHIAGPTYNSEAIIRKTSYKNHLNSKNTPVREEWIIDAGFGFMNGYYAIQKLLPWIKTGELQAITFTDDYSAMGGYRYLLSQGIRVPEDIMITGYGGSLVNLFSSVPITTVSNHYEHMAKTALDLLFQDKKDSTDICIVCPTILHIHASTGSKKEPELLQDVLKNRPMVGLFLQQYFSDTNHAEEFWIEISQFLSIYDIPSFVVMEYMPVNKDLFTYYERKIELLFYYQLGEVQNILKSGNVHELTDFFLEAHSADPLISRTYWSGEQIQGFIISSLVAASTEYLDVIISHCAAWLENRQQVESTNRMKNKLSDTLSQLMANNRRINELTMYNNRNSLPGIQSSAINGVNSKVSQNFIILIISIDKFADIITRHGIKEGEKILHIVQTSLYQCLRQTDKVLKQSDESFLLFFQNTDSSVIQLIEQRMLDQIDRINDSHKNSYIIDLTWGYASSNGHEPLEEVINRAKFMHVNKQKERLG